MKKKILILIPSLKFGGGAEKIATTIGTQLFFRKYDIFYFTFYDFKDKYEFKGKYFSLNEKISLNIFINIYKMFKRAYMISKFIKKNKINTTISFMEEANFSLILSSLFNKYNSKKIISIRVSITNYNLIYKFLIFILYFFVDSIILVSKKMKSELIFKKSKVIYNLKNLNSVKKKSLLKVDNFSNIFKENNFIFVNVGRLTKQKGQCFLIRSFKKVVEKYSNAKLIILGEGELKNKLQDLINKLNLKNNVFLLGNQKNPYYFIKKSNCFVLTSLFEGFPNVLIEALVLNIPIISTDCETGPREILDPKLNIYKKINYPYFGEFGVLIPKISCEFIWENLVNVPLLNEEEILSIQMINFINDKKLNQKYANGLKRAKDFDINVIIKKWEKII